MTRTMCMRISTATPNTTTRNIESECDAITAKACCVCYHMTYSDYNALLYIHTIKVSCKVDIFVTNTGTRHAWTIVGIHKIPTPFVVRDGLWHTIIHFILTLAPLTLIANNSPLGRQISSGGVGSNCWIKYLL